MAKERQGFLLFHDLRGVLTMLSDEQRGRLLMAMLDYSEGGIIPALGDPALEIAFEVAKEKIDRYARKMDELSERRADAGRKGAQAKLNKAKQS